MNWDIAANIAEVVTSISILVTMIQLVREMRSQNWESFFYIHEYLSQDTFGEARKKVRTDLYRKEYVDWSEEDRAAANRVCSSYDQAGILLSGGLLNKKAKAGFLASSWGRSIVDQYESLRPFLDDMQTPTLTGREFFHHFEWIYHEAIEYQKEERRIDEKDSTN